MPTIRQVTGLQAALDSKGDMLKSVYDTDADGVIDPSALPDAVFSNTDFGGSGTVGDPYTVTGAKSRANHTGTQLSSTISDFSTSALTAAPAETTTTEGALINGATAKTTPVDADFIGLMDSAASNVLKKLSWSNIKATLKTYFDGIYESLTNKDATGGYAGLTLFKINFKNAANTFTSFFTNTNTAARTYTFQDRNGTIADDTDLALKANLASPTFTGTPTLPTGTIATTQSAADSTTKVATTAFVTTADNLKANLASPTFTGTPLSTTAAVDTNTTQIATTAFVIAQAGAATPIIDGSATVGTSTRFSRADHIHPTDTSRAAAASPTFSGTIAGTYTIGGTPTFPSSIVQLTSTQTLTNKRWTARVGSTTSSATPTINTDNTDIYKLTAQTADITSFTTNLSGTPVDGDILEIQITGTAARAITWGASFVASTVSLPTTTVTTATLSVVFQYFTTSSYGTNKWVCVNSF